MKRGAYGKALQSLTLGDHLVVFTAWCVGHDAQERRCHGFAGVEDYGLTKRDAMKAIIAEGWTYDDEGQWKCSLCNESEEAQ